MLMKEINTIKEIKFSIQRFGRCFYFISISLNLIFEFIVERVKT
jgi:hypothetical protein